MNEIDNNGNIKDVLNRIGSCSELISIDPYFKDISV